MNLPRRSTLAGALAIAVLAPAHAATTPIAAWNFENVAKAVNNSPAASTGTGAASSIGMDLYATPNVGVTTDDVVAGATTDTGTNGNADLSNSWRIRGQAGANGPANGWSSLAPIGTQGAVFAASTAAVTGPITVSFDWYATSQGEANLQLQYTTDGTAWNNLALTLGGSDGGLAAKTNTSSANTVLGSFVSIANGGGQNWFTGLTATINDPLAVNAAKFAIAMVNASTGADNLSAKGTALNNSSGNWRFDNVSISSVSAVPEPSGIALAGLGLAGLVFAKRRQIRG